MAASFQDTDTIKLALFDELKNILSNSTDVRTKAEERLNQLKVTDGYGVYLAEITVDQGLDLAVRQLSSVMLKQYVEKSWILGDDDEGMLKPLASEQAKKVIKSILPEGLYDANSKIRSAVAYTISTIASYDWPENWSELFEIIVKCLGGNENSVHGAMQVLVEFTYDLNTQIGEVGPLILSEVYRIFEADTIYTARTRSSAVEILCSVLKSANAHLKNKQEIANMVNPILPSFIQKLINGLTVPLGAQSTFSLKTEIVRVLTYMVSDMPKFINPYLPQILPPIWQLLTQIADVYIKVIINGSEDSPFDDSSEDNDNEQFIKMILQIFEFIYSIIESKRFRPNVEAVLQDLIYILILYMQMTEEQVENWAEDAEKFVEDEDEEGVSYSVRTSGQDILTLIGDEFNEKMLPHLTTVLGKHVTIADANRNANNPNWWKIHEASMLALGSYMTLILENENAFNLSEYLNLVRGLLAYDVSPYLTGRCLWLMSRCVESKSYNSQMLQELINNIHNGMRPDKPVVLRISAARSIYGICTHLMTGTEEQHQVIASKLPEFFEDLLQLISQSGNTVLGWSLETMAAVLKFDKNATAQISTKAIPLTIAIFLKYSDDRFILDSVTDVMKVLCKNPYSMVPLQEKLIPTLVSIFNLHGEQANSGLQDISLFILETIVKYSSTPLSEVLIESAFPAVIQCLLRTEDYSVLSSGGECLRAFIFSSPEQVCRYNNGEGLNYIMQVTTMLLNPLNTESSAAFIGRLVITIIAKAGNFLGAHTDMLLKAVISKMQLVETLSVMMSLLMPFAYLILVQLDAVLNFLSTVPGPTGEPAMNFVLTHWLTRQPQFYGIYERKLTALALCKLFEHGITTKDVRLTNVQIKELQPLPGTQNTVKTRAQSTAQSHWVNLPVLVKIFKLLLNELEALREFREASDEEESTDDESFIENDLLNVSSGKDLSKIIFKAIEDDVDEDDDQIIMMQLMQDPIFQGDIEEILKKFIQNFTRNEQFELFKPMLNETDMQILQEISS